MTLTTRVRRVLPEVRAERARRRRAHTLARRLTRWTQERERLEAHPHPSPGRHAQRLATIAWHVAMIGAETQTLENGDQP